MDRARWLLGLSQGNDSTDKTLASCAAILCCAGLAKMVADVLSYLAEYDAIESDIPVGNTKYASLLAKGLATQTKECPAMLSDGRYHIESANGVFKTLKQMIHHRNNLAHIPDGSIRLHGDDPWLKVKDGILTASIPIRADPWDQIRIAEASRMIEATECYWSEVIDANADMKEGGLLSKSK
jgi:hypothetical protein